MSLPTSGPISLNDIRVELGASSTNVSLGTMSDTAGFLAPDKVSDFYGYPPLISFYITTGAYKNTDFCGISTPVEKWHNGSAILPTVGDTIYSNSTGTTVYTWLRRHGISTTSTGTAFQGMQMGSTSGVIGSMYLCL